MKYTYAPLHLSQYLGKGNGKGAEGRTAAVAQRFSPFFVVWKYLESFPEALLLPKFGNLVFILSTLRRAIGGR